MQKSTVEGLNLRDWLFQPLIRPLPTTAFCLLRSAFRLLTPDFGLLISDSWLLPSPQHFKINPLRTYLLSAGIGNDHLQSIVTRSQFWRQP